MRMMYYSSMPVSLSGIIHHSHSFTRLEIYHHIYVMYDVCYICCHIIFGIQKLSIIIDNEDKILASIPESKFCFLG